MKWEFLGVQHLTELKGDHRGYTYNVNVWRSPVPGGWLLMSMNERSQDPQGMISFYPDERHVWNGLDETQFDDMLRPLSNTV